MQVWIALFALVFSANRLHNPTIVNKRGRHHLTQRKRKARSDRNHIVYSLSVKGLEYIGVTFVERRSPALSLRRRWQKHVRRALTEDRSWNLCRAIRKHGPEAFEVQVLEVVRGKALAHQVERDLIRTRKPRLNTDVR